MASPKASDSKRGKDGISWLPGWITASLGSEWIGVSRQYMWDLINAKKIEAHGVRGTGERAAFTVVREANALKLARERASRLGCPECCKVIEAALDAREVPDWDASCTHREPAAGAQEDAEVLDALGV